MIKNILKNKRSQPQVRKKFLIEKVLIQELKNSSYISSAKIYKILNLHQDCAVRKVLMTFKSQNSNLTTINILRKNNKRDAVYVILHKDFFLEPLIKKFMHYRSSGLYFQMIDGCEGAFYKLIEKHSIGRPHYKMDKHLGNNEYSARARALRRAFYDRLVHNIQNKNSYTQNPDIINLKVYINSIIKQLKTLKLNLNKKDKSRLYNLLFLSYSRLKKDKGKLSRSFLRRLFIKMLDILPPDSLDLCFKFSDILKISINAIKAGVLRAKNPIRMIEVFNEGYFFKEYRIKPLSKHEWLYRKKQKELRKQKYNTHILGPSARKIKKLSLITSDLIDLYKKRITFNYKLRKMLC